jgi:hypothetical protein
MTVALDPGTEAQTAYQAGLLTHVAALALHHPTIRPEVRLAAISTALTGYADPDDRTELLTALLAYSSDPATVTFERFTAPRLLGYDSASKPVLRPVTGCESLDLHCCPGELGLERFGQLVEEGGATVADVSLVLIPGRLPRGARTALARTRIPFGKLVTGVERRPVYARRVDGTDGHAVEAQAVMWWNGKPVALAAEKIRLGWVMGLSRPGNI